MNDAHVTAEELLALQRGALPPERVGPLFDHVAGCVICTDEAAHVLPLEQMSKGLLEDDSHPDIDSQLFPFVDGTLPSAIRKTVERHLAACSSCREDVEMLAATRATLALPQRRSWRLPAAVAASVTIPLIAALMAWRTPSWQGPTLMPPRRAATAYPREWREAVAQIVARPSLDAPPVFLALQPVMPRLRGPEPPEVGRVVAPLAVIVESSRPELTWTLPAGGTAVASLYDGAALIEASPPLHDTRWRPSHDLPRGRVYAWQVEVVHRGETSILPPPSAPPARFAVLGAAEAAELARARVMTPNDHLLLAVLSARAGLQAEAEHELQALVAQRPADPLPRALLASVQGWSSR